MKPTLTLIAASLVFASQVFAAPGSEKAEAPKKAPAPKGTPKTFADLHYGDDPMQVMDVWLIKDGAAKPVLFFIHGGGWVRGSKAISPEAYLKAGIAVVSIEYRMVPAATAAGVKPAVQWPLHDAARALQFVRAHAAEWNIDKTRVIASGGSAGACTSLWLAFHDDMADPKSNDPVARESTRLTAAAVNGAQTTLDPKMMKEWTPNSRYGAHAFNITGDTAKKISAFDQYLAKRDEIMPWIKEYSPYHLVTSDDPPVYLNYGTPPAMGKDEKDPTHSANFGVGLQQRCKEVGVKCELYYPGATDTAYKTTTEYIIAKLTAK